MIPAQTLFNCLVFTLVSGGTFSLWQVMEKKWRRRLTLGRMLGADQGLPSPSKGSPALTKMALTLGRLAVPKNKGELAKTAEKLSYAGFREAEAVPLFYGIKLGLGLALAAALLAVATVTGWDFLNSPLILFIPLGAGYMLPDAVLSRMIQARKTRIFRELPDTLDLLEICLQAGLGLDYALYRVCCELSQIAPVLSGEFGRYFLEIRAGLERPEALENLGARNGSDSLNQVVTVFLQSLKIGSDMAVSLNTHTQAMRQERAQTAEEKGAKLSTKLTLPLVIFILPALMLIILGPVILNFISLANDGF